MKFASKISPATLLLAVSAASSVALGATGLGCTGDGGEMQPGETRMPQDEDATNGDEEREGGVQEGEETREGASQHFILPSRIATGPDRHAHARTIRLRSPWTS